jgi:hypothetical protein
MEDLARSDLTASKVEAIEEGKAQARSLLGHNSRWLRQQQRTSSDWSVCNTAPSSFTTSAVCAPEEEINESPLLPAGASTRASGVVGCRESFGCLNWDGMPMPSAGHGLVGLALGHGSRGPPDRRNDQSCPR